MQVVINQADIQTIADLIVSIDYFYGEVNNLKSNINYKRKIMGHKEDKHDFTLENYQFSNFNIKSLTEIRDNLSKEVDEFEEEERQLDKWLSEHDMDDLK